MELERLDAYLKAYVAKHAPLTKVEGSFGDYDLTVTSKDAKHFFFLKPLHLKSLERIRVQTWWGGGHPRYYDVKKVLQKSLEVHLGKDKLVKKIEQRKLREAKKKRKREEAIEQAKTIDLTSEKENAKKACNKRDNRSIDLKKLQKSCKTKVIKDLLTWDYMRKKNYSSGVGKGTTRMDRISSEQFCALAGVSNLDVLEKRGAWYTASKVSYDQVFGDDAFLRGRGGRFQCNKQLGLDDEADVTLKYARMHRRLNPCPYLSTFHTCIDSPCAGV